MSLVTTANLSLEHALGLADSHYENFPTASALLSKRYRQVVRLIYAFARTADDIADEGQYSDEWRLAQLAIMHQHLDNPNGHAFFAALMADVHLHHLSAELLHDLLRAFEQDVITKRFANHQSVLRYCHYSARPIGRLLLQLHQQATPAACRYSDALCSSLQLINFLQDIKSDYADRNRIYMPMTSLARFGVPEGAFVDDHPQLSSMLAFELERATVLFNKGAKIAPLLTGRLQAQTCLTIAAGRQVLSKLAARKESLACPQLKWYDWPIIGIKALTEYVT